MTSSAGFDASDQVNWVRASSSETAPEDLGPSITGSRAVDEGTYLAAIISGARELIQSPAILEPLESDFEGACEEPASLPSDEPLAGVSTSDALTMNSTPKEDGKSATALGVGAAPLAMNDGTVRDLSSEALDAIEDDGDDNAVASPHALDVMLPFGVNQRSTFAVAERAPEASPADSVAGRGPSSLGAVVAPANEYPESLSGNALSDATTSTEALLDEMLHGADEDQDEGESVILERLPETTPPAPWPEEATDANSTSNSTASASTSDISSLVATLSAEATSVTTGDATLARINETATQRIRRATELAARGAQFAARVELLASLRTLTQAADKRAGSSHRSLELANGLRALDEAKDFAARGAELDADLDVASIAASHQSPIAKAESLGRLMPQEAADLYYRFSQKSLGKAVVGSPAGSMALYSLGKLYSQLGVSEPQQHPDAARRAFAFQQAALAARPDNDMAAHELGVLMAEAGHLLEAASLLNQVAERRPHPVVLKNLANVQRRLGNAQAAQENEQRAAALASAFPHEGPVQWVAPEEFARTAHRASGIGASQ